MTARLQEMATIAGGYYDEGADFITVRDDQRQKLIPPADTERTFTFMHANTHHGKAGTNLQTSCIDYICRLIQEHRPDAVSLNEVEHGPSMYTTAPQLVQYLDTLNTLTGLTWEGFWYQAYQLQGQGNAVLTPHHFESVRGASIGGGRGISQAKLSLNGVIFTVCSAHFDNKDAGTRLSNARKAVLEMQSYATLPSENVLLGVDANCQAADAPIQHLIHNGYQDTWAQAGSNATGPTSSNQGNTKNTRIDYVFALPRAITLQRVQVLNTNVTTEGSDHRPVVAAFTY